MHIVVNGEAKDIPEGLSVRALLEHLDLTSGPCAVEINREVIPRATHGARMIAEGDVIEIVHLVGGG